MRLAFLTDIHLNASADHFHMQPRWVEGTDVLLERFSAWADESGVDLIVFGGDLVHDGTPERIEEAVHRLEELFHHPSLICLGNHDVTFKDAGQTWRQLVGAWPSARLADDVIDVGECTVIGLNNQWMSDEGPKLYFDPSTWPVPCVSQQQLEWLDATLADHADKPAIVCLHTAPDPLHPGIESLGIPIPAYPEDNAAAFNAVLDRHTHCRLLLAGHWHVTWSGTHRHRMHVTTAAACEFPFDVRLVELVDDEITIRTEHLIPAAESPDHVEWDASRPWVSGTRSDRHIVLPAPTVDEPATE